MSSFLPVGAMGETLRLCVPLGVCGCLRVSLWVSLPSCTDGIRACARAASSGLHPTKQSPTDRTATSPSHFPPPGMGALALLTLGSATVRLYPPPAPADLDATVLGAAAAVYSDPPPSSAVLRQVSMQQRAWGAFHPRQPCRQPLHLPSVLPPHTQLYEASAAQAALTCCNLTALILWGAGLWCVLACGGDYTWCSPQAPTPACRTHACRCQSPALQWWSSPALTCPHLPLWQVAHGSDLQRHQ